MLKKEEELLTLQKMRLNVKR